MTNMISSNSSAARDSQIPTNDEHVAQYATATSAAAVYCCSNVSPPVTCGSSFCHLFLTRSLQLTLLHPISFMFGICMASKCAASVREFQPFFCIACLSLQHFSRFTISGFLQHMMSRARASNPHHELHCNFLCVRLINSIFFFCAAFAGWLAG